MRFRPSDESWPESCEGLSVPLWATSSPRLPPRVHPGCSRSSRQPLYPGNGVHRQGHGSQGAQGRYCEKTQVLPPPSEQALPAASGAPPALRPSPPLGHCLALSLGWASLGSFPQLSALEMEDQSRGEAKSCGLSRPRPSWPRSVGPVAPQPPGVDPPHFLSCEPHGSRWLGTPLSANRAGPFSSVGRLAWGHSSLSGAPPALPLPGGCEAHLQTW